MHHIRLTCCLLFLCGLSDADELVRSIPADGAWARFHWSERWNDGEDRILQFTFKAVGTKTVGDQRCRWIEVRVQSEESVRKGVGTAYKLLIPEQELKADGDAVKAAIEVWRKPADENAHKIEGLIDNPRLYLLLFPLLPGRVRERQILKERETVAWQRGTLDCAIVEGQVKDSFTYDRVTGRCRFVVHESVPFGFAAVHLKIDNADAEHGVVSLSLIDQGTDAVSDLPNVK